MPTYLKNLKIKTLGSVDTPANQHGQALLFKRAEGAPAAGGIVDDVSKVQSAALETVLPTSVMEKLTAAINKAFSAVLKPEELVQKSAKDLYATLYEDWMQDFVWNILWDINYAFRESVESILMDSSVEDKQTAVQNVTNQYVDILSQHGVFDTYGVTKSAEGKHDVEQILKSFGDKTKVPAELRGVIASLELSKALPEGDNPMTATPATTNTVEELLSKNANLPAEVVEALKKSAALETQVGELSQQMAIEKAARVTGEYIAKAATYTSLPTAEANFAEILKGLGTKAPEEFAQLEVILKAANEAISKGDLFKEIGGAGTPVTTSAWDEVEKRAADLAKDSSITKEQAISRVLQADGELYKRYTAGE